MDSDLKEALRNVAGEAVKILAALVAFFVAVGVVVAGASGVWMVIMVGVRACELVYGRLQQWSW